MKTIRKYAWQLVSTILAIIAILAAYHRVFISRPTKALQVIVDQPVSLVDIRPEAAQDIEVFYRGESVSNISLLQARVKNSGNQPITEDDYSRPLSFSFAPGSNLADVAVAMSDPPNIGMIISQTSECRAEAVPTLLNPGDTVTVRFVVIGGSSDSILEDLETDARIAGVREVEFLPSSPEQPPSALLIVGVFIGGVIVNMLAAFVTESTAGALKSLYRRISAILSGRSTKKIVTPEDPEQVSKRISLQAWKGQYVSAENADELTANQDEIREQEIFELTRLEGDSIALRAWNGKYVCAEGDGKVVANRDAISTWETFELIGLKGDTIALRAWNGKYVCAEDGGGREVVANRDEIREWETFTPIRHN